MSDETKENVWTSVSEGNEAPKVDPGLPGAVLSSNTSSAEFPETSPKKAPATKLPPVDPANPRKPLQLARDPSRSHKSLAEQAAQLERNRCKALAKKAGVPWGVYKESPEYLQSIAYLEFRETEALRPLQRAKDKRDRELDKQAAELEAKRVKKDRDDSPEVRLLTEDEATVADQDNTSDSLSLGLARHIKNNKTRVGVLGVNEPALAILIKDYLDSLDEVPVRYTRSQLINDLILNVKDGRGGFANILVELLGFNTVAEEFTVNIIDYADVETEELGSSGRLDLATGEYVDVDTKEG